MQPLVTIAIPTYNRADGHLRDVIDASLRQTWENLEIVVGDNASTDDTPALVSGFDDPRLRYIRHETNIGANGNFNHLLKEARGEWFLLFHDDDMIDDDFVESCMRVVEPDTTHAFIRTGVRAINADGAVLKERPNTLIGTSREDFYLSWFRSRTGLYLCNTLYHTARLREVGGFRSVHNLLEDNFAIAKLLERWTHGNVTEIKASYRYTYDQRTYRVPVVSWCEDFRELLRRIEDQCTGEKRDDVSNEGRRFFGRLCVRRANALASTARRVVARLQVARFFGPGTLRQPWTNKI